MADPKFFYQVVLHQGSATNNVSAPVVQSLPISNKIQALVVMLFSEENGYDGMFLWSNKTRVWRPVLTPELLSKGIIDGYEIHLYYELAADIEIEADGAIILRNNAAFDSTTLTPGTGLIYTVMIPVFGTGAGTVKSVNGELPDANGNVQINAADIDGVVLTVNQIGPDAQGNVQLDAADVNAINVDQIGAPGGVAPLDSNSWVPTENLPPSIMGGLSYQGTYDASTDTPPLPAPDVDNKGFYWVVSVAGTYVPENLSLNVGDWIVSNGISYDKIDNQEGRVLTVNGAAPDASTGNVVVPYANTTTAGTVYAPTDGGLIIGPDGELTINTAQVGAWTPSETVWVDLNGSATEGTGKQNNPYRTIGEAIDNAPANAVIMISPGSYAESLVLGSKPLYIKGWGNVGNYARTSITGNVVVGGANQIRIQDLGINYNGTQPCFSITSVGTTAGFKFENIVINANNTQTALQTDASAGAWTGSAYFVSLYVNAGKINHAAGTGYVTTRMFPQDSTSTLEVHGGTVDLTEVWHLNSILHTAGTLQVFRARSIGTDPGVAALVSTADSSAGNFLLLHKVGTWLNPTAQSYVSKTGNCPYVIDGLTRNLTNDVFNGVMVPLKTEQDQDTVVSYTGVNYTGARGAYLPAHLGGIDTALGLRLRQLASIGTGTTLVGVATNGEVKSLAAGTGVSVTGTTNTVTVTNTGVIALSNVGGAGTTSLVNTATGQLKSIQGAGGLTVSESGGVITLTSSQASTGVTTLNGLTNAVTLVGNSPISVVVNGQDINISYTGLRSLNGVVGAGQLIEGLGIDIDTTGQNLTVTNTGVRFMQAGATQLTGGVVLVAGENVTLTPDSGANTITIDSTGGGGTGGVTSVNTLQGALTIASGTGIAVSAMGSTITVSATGAANPVATLNTLSGNLNLVGEGGITVTAQGADTLLVTYDGGASVAVTSLNTMTGDVTLVAGTGITIDSETTPGSIVITAPPTGIQNVQTIPDGGTPGAVSLIESVSAGVANLKNLLPSSTINLVDTPEGIQISTLGGGGGGGSVSTVAGIGPDGSGNVPLTAQDLGALKADGTVPFTANLDAATFTIDNLADPVAAQQPVTLNYVETLMVDQGTF